MKLSNRWKGTTRAQRTEVMKERARQLHAKLTPEEKKERARKMVAGRGHWEGTGKNKRYVRHTK